MRTYPATSTPGVPAGRRVDIADRPNGVAYPTTPEHIVTVDGGIPSFKINGDIRYVYAQVERGSTYVIRATGPLQPDPAAPTPATPGGGGGGGAAPMTVVK